MLTSLFYGVAYELDPTIFDSFPAGSGLYHPKGKEGRSSQDLFLNKYSSTDFTVTFRPESHCFLRRRFRDRRSSRLPVASTSSSKSVIR
jgi:hypothetical protein